MHFIVINDPYVAHGSSKLLLDAFFLANLQMHNNEALSQIDIIAFLRTSWSLVQVTSVNCFWDHRFLEPIEVYDSVQFRLLCCSSSVTKICLFKYTENFITKELKFPRKIISDIFHISAQNIDCGYSLESTRRVEFQRNFLSTKENRKKMLHVHVFKLGK